MRLAYRCQMEDEGWQGCLPIGGTVLHNEILQVSNRM